MNPLLPSGPVLPAGRTSRLSLVSRLGLLGLLLLTGCGEEGPRRYELSGKVTFQGQPVPAGMIRFEPDPSAGNRGPAGTAPIEDGRYTTPPGQGVIGGPHVVVIHGGDGQPIPGEPDIRYGRMLFPPYRTRAELPEADGTCDFHVPAGGR